jgi:hypothetical protein
MLSAPITCNEQVARCMPSVTRVTKTYNSFYVRYGLKTRKNASRFSSTKATTKISGHGRQQKWCRPKVEPVPDVSATEKPLQMLMMPNISNLDLIKFSERMSRRGRTSNFRQARSVVHLADAIMIDHFLVKADMSFLVFNKIFNLEIVLFHPLLESGPPAKFGWDSSKSPPRRKVISVTFKQAFIDIL